MDDSLNQLLGVDIFFQVTFEVWIPLVLDYNISKITFSTRYGFNVFRIISFGLSNASMACMDHINIVSDPTRTSCASAYT